MAKHQLQTRGVIFDISDTLLVGGVSEDMARVNYVRPGLLDAFAWLTEKNIKVGVVTSFSERGAAALLSQANIISFFDTEHIVGSDSVRKLEVERTERVAQTGWRGLLGATQEVKVKKVIDHTLHEKPHPEPVRYLLNDWNVQPDRVAYVGDDAYADMMCAVNADVRFMQITPISFDPDLDLLRFLKDRIQ